MTNANANIFLQAGEYHVYTSVRVPLPNAITGMEEQNPVTQIGSVSFYPNPSAVESYITFDSESRSDVSILVFDILGNEIATIANEKNLPAGHHEWKWNLQNNSGSKVSKGIYFVRVQNNGVAETGKIIVE